jgi:hypothetical protein
MNPNLITVYQSPFPKRRIGRWSDGGYAIADIPGIKYDALFAGGVCDDISFEEDFIRFQNTPIQVYAFDGTVDCLPYSPFQHQIKFIKKNIGEFETTEYTNLHNLFLQYIKKPNSNDFDSSSVGTSAFLRNPTCLRQSGFTSNIFVKMDIEGGEVDWIRSLNKDHMDIIAQFVMEFHNPFDEEEIEMFKKINETHLLIHFHPNNVGGARIHNGTYIPNIFECTYLHKRFFYNGVAELNMDYIPNDAVDVRNLGFKDEIWMSHPPFVHFDKFTRRV